MGEGATLVASNLLAIRHHKLVERIILPMETFVASAVHGNGDGNPERLVSVGCDGLSRPVESVLGNVSRVFKLAVGVHLVLQARNATYRPRGVDVHNVHRFRVRIGIPNVDDRLVRHAARAVLIDPRHVWARR
eukprot:scaffold1197_cov65-Phaeocystis_antarctica.AAC.2